MNPIRLEAKRLAQVAQAAPQVVSRLRLGTVWPQRVCEPGPLDAAAAAEHEQCEQRLAFASTEWRKLPPALQDRERTEQPHFERRRGSVGRPWCNHTSASRGRDRTSDAADGNFSSSTTESSRF